MRKVLKVLGPVLGVVVLLVAGLLGFLALKKPAQRPASAERFEPTPARLALLSPVQQDAARAMRRQALHAYRLGFRHPRSGEQLVWESDLPADIEMLIASLESV